MKLSKASDYALVFLAKLGTGPQEEWLSVREVAEGLGIPSRFASNIVHNLCKSGILESHRGAHGGVKLAKPIEKITIGDVLEAMEDTMGLVDCISSPGQCPIEDNCDVLKFWSVTHTLVLSTLKHITLKDIISYVYEKGPKPNIGEPLPALNN